MVSELPSEQISKASLPTPPVVRKIHALCGPNIFAYMPVIHVILDSGPYDELPSNEFPGFIDRLTAWLPGLQTHECSVGRPGGFIERLHRGTYLPHIVEHVTLELQNMMGFNVTFGRARPTGESGVYNVIFAYREEEPARQAFETALSLTLAAMHGTPYNVESALERLMDAADEYRLGPSTAAIVDAARRRRIPVLRLTPKSSLVQLGYGVYQRRIQASETSFTSGIAVEMCQEKSLTNQMLRTVGVTVPDGEEVATEDEAWEVAQRIGLPVVVKPQDGNQGKGVNVNLQTETDIRAAFRIAREVRGSGVLVEKYIEGDDYRLLVVNGKMVAATRREPAQVVGDGIHTIVELIAEVNNDPRRRPGHSSVMTRIKLGEIEAMVLKGQSLNPASVPAKGQVVKLRRNANLSTGGTATDVTDDVHPRNVRLAELAAQILALDVAGIDMLCKDITRPLHEQNGAIVEVNAAPGLRMHLYPAVGKSRDVGVPIVEMLYPNNSPSRIPIIAVTGTNGKTTVTRLISHIYETARWVTGMTSTEGVYINKEQIISGDCSGPKSAQAVLLHPHVEVAILETARGGILREGLAFDWCQVGVVTNVSTDHLGMSGINTLEELARVKQVVVEAVARDGAAVLNAQDPLVAEMAAATDAEVIYFSTDPNHIVVCAHLAEDEGRAVTVQNGSIVLMRGNNVDTLVELARVPFTMGGQIEFQVMNALAAVAAAWAAGVNPAMIVRALTTFQSDFQMTPGRFNVQDINGVQVVTDYGHNEAAVKALAKSIQALGERQTVTVLALPGDRREADLIATAQATVPFTSRYILHDLLDRRERAENEIPELLRQNLPASIPSEIVSDQVAAIHRAWQLLHPGDRLVVIVDKPTVTQNALMALANADVDPGSCTTPIGDSASEEDNHYQPSGITSTIKTPV
jgi:cyanophycin synthetase